MDSLSPTAYYAPPPPPRVSIGERVASIFTVWRVRPPSPRPSTLRAREQFASQLGASSFSGSPSASPVSALPTAPPSRSQGAPHPVSFAESPRHASSGPAPVAPASAGELKNDALVSDVPVVSRSQERPHRTRERKDAPDRVAEEKNEPQYLTKNVSSAMTIADAQQSPPSSETLGSLAPSSGQLVATGNVGKTIARRRTARLISSAASNVGVPKKKNRRPVAPVGDAGDAFLVRLPYDQARRQRGAGAGAGAGIKTKNGDGADSESANVREVGKLGAGMRRRTPTPRSVSVAKTHLSRRSRMRRLLKIVALTLACGAAILLVVAATAIAYWCVRGVPMAEIPDRLARLQTHANVPDWMYHTYSVTAAYGQAAGNTLRYRIVPLLYDTTASGFAYIDRIARAATSSRPATGPPLTADAAATDVSTAGHSRPPPPANDFVAPLARDLAVSASTTVEEQLRAIAYDETLTLSRGPSEEPTEAAVAGHTPLFVVASSSPPPPVLFPNARPVPPTTDVLTSGSATVAPDPIIREEREEREATLSASSATSDVNKGVAATTALVARRRLRLDGGRPTPNERTLYCVVCGLACGLVARHISRRCVDRSASTETGDDGEDMESTSDGAAVGLDPQTSVRATSDAVTSVAGTRCDVCQTCNDVAAVLARDIHVRRIIVPAQAHNGGNGRRAGGSCGKGMSRVAALGKRLCASHKHICADLPVLALFQTQAHQYLRATSLTPPRHRAVDIHLARRHNDAAVTRRLTFDPRQDSAGPRLHWDTDVSTAASAAPLAASDMGECMAAIRATALLVPALGAHADVAVHVEAHASDTQPPMLQLQLQTTSATAEHMAPARFWTFMADLGAPCLVSALSEWRRHRPRPSTPAATPSGTTASVAAKTLQHDAPVLHVTSIAATTILIRHMPGNGLPHRHHTVHLQPAPSPSSLTTDLTRLLAGPT